MSSRCPQVLLSATPGAEDYAWPDVRIRPRIFESRPFRPSDKGLILFAYIPFMRIGVFTSCQECLFFLFSTRIFLIFFTSREAALKDQGRLRVNLQSSFSPTALIASDLCGSVLGCINKNRFIPLVYIRQSEGQILRLPGYRDLMTSRCASASTHL